MTNHSNCRHLVFCAILLFFSCSLIFAQPPGGGARGQGQRGQGGGVPGGFQPGGGGGQFQGGQRPGGPGGPGGGQFVPGGGGQFPGGQRPGRPGQPTEDSQSGEENQEPVMVTGPGTVPEIRDENTQEEFEVRPLADRAVLSRPVPAKMLRYAEHLISKYDTNGNGRLEFDEWYGKMSGSPQVIDLNGDGIITLDEIATHIEQFSVGRTIHNPFPLQQLLANRVIPEQKRPAGIFRPITQPVSSRKISDSQFIPDQPSLTDEELAEGVRSVDNEADDETDDEKQLFMGNLPAAQIKKYAAPTEGLPAWFVQRDTNGDGQVSLYEFCAPNFRDEDMAMFAYLDKDGDGFIIPDELPRAEEK